MFPLNNPHPSNAQPSAYVIICLVAPIVLALIAVAIIVWRIIQRRRLFRDVEQYVRDLSEDIPDFFYGREFLYVLFTSLFDVPTNFLEVNEPSFAPIRLGWLLGMLEQLGSTATMSCGYLDRAAHPDNQILTMEFWVDFDYADQRWAIWYPGRGDYTITRRSAFSNYVGTIHRRHAFAEIDAWLRRSGFAEHLP